MIFIESDHVPDTTQFFGKLGEDIAAIEEVTEGDSRPNDTEVSTQFLDNLHSKCHWSVEKTHKTLHFHGISVPKKQIEQSIEKCFTCRNPRKIAPLAKLHPRPTPKEPFDELHIDVIDKTATKRQSDNAFQYQMIPKIEFL